MNINVWVSIAAVSLTAGISVMVLWADRRSFVHQIFIIGMILLALRAGMAGLAFNSVLPDQAILWQQYKIIIDSFLPVVWLLFSVSFARVNYQEQISKWKWVSILSLVLPLSLVTFFRDAFFVGPVVLLEESTLLLHIGWSGYLWHLIWVMLSLIILMNLERTFRHASGHMRWQTKFMFLGIGGIFGIRIFSDSQVILFKSVNTGLDIVDIGALLVANLLILRSLFRGRPLNVSVQLSHHFLYNSFTVLIVGIYFICVGVIAWFSIQFQWIRNIHLAIFLLFLAIMGIAVILLSDRLRMKRKRFISRHFKRPQYDYQKIWEDFTARTASVTTIKELCHVIVKMVSETLEILSVSIWLVDEKLECLSFGGSTVLTEEQFVKLKFYGQGGGELIRAMIGQAMPIDLKLRTDDWIADLKDTYIDEYTKESQTRYCVSLNAAGHLIGIMTLSEKVFYETLSFEEAELLKTIADQAAAGLLNLRMSEQLRQAKELEAFQSMSAFFLHDLKNLASKLSLVTQNLPTHMDNPEFRADAVRAISQSVTKINNMSSRLSLLSQKLNLNMKECGINEVVSEAIKDTVGYVKSTVKQELGTITPFLIDREQIHKVIENLLLNASDALMLDNNRRIDARDSIAFMASVDEYKVDGDHDLISVSTSCRENWAEIIVKDKGCGMSKEFIEKSLFRPFHTTKKQGMGIGLYHCKTIVEAHGGRIEVESEEGRGTMFRILLPMMAIKADR